MYFWSVIDIIPVVALYAAVDGVILGADTNVWLAMLVEGITSRTVTSNVLVVTFDTFNHLS